MAMEGPAVKRPKLQLENVQRSDWLRWSDNLEKLQKRLATGCLCNIEMLELQRPIFPSKTQEPCQTSAADLRFLRDYTLQFISSMSFFIDTALQQQAQGFICGRLMHMASGLAMDEGIWEMLIEYLDSTDKFVTLAASKCLVNLLMWTKLPNLNEIFDELFNSVIITTNNPIKLSHILDIIRGVVEYKYESDHPLELEDNTESHQEPDNNEINSASDVNMTDMSEEDIPSSFMPRLTEEETCMKVEVDTEVETEVRTHCVKALENWWNRLREKFRLMMINYDPVNESPVATFLSLWLSIISIKNNLFVVDTKHYYMHLEEFVPILNQNSPTIVLRKLTDIFNEILCYGSTLSLQEVPNEEPCDLAHLIIRYVRSRQFLQGIPYSRDFSGFGGSRIGPVDWEWESGNRDHRLGIDFSPQKILQNPSSSRAFLQDAIPSSSKSHPSTSQAVSFPKAPQNSLIPVSTSLPIPSSNTKDLKQNSPQHLKALPISKTIYIGPSRDALQLDESFQENLGDRPLLQKVVLLILKSVAVTVKEFHADDSDSSEEDRSSGDGSMNSGSESEGNDVAFVERSIRDVFRELDLYVKSVQPFHPGTPLGEWIVKLFVDQDDALIEALLCVLDTYRGFLGRIEIPADFKETFHPFKTFVTLLSSISYDKDVLLDWLMGRETCFLMYLLCFLKLAFKNWPEFVTCCGRDLDNTMKVLIRLRMSVGRLVERSLFPYNINPVLRLLERCEELYETNVGNNS